MMKHLNLLSTNLALHGILIYRLVLVEGTSFWGTFFPMAFVGLVSALLAIGIEAPRGNNAVTDDDKRGSHD